MTSAGPSTLSSMRIQFLAGLGVCVLLIGGFGGWAATAELAGAVIAPGSVVVETNLKKVQHPTGGVVGELHVKDGMLVRAGDVLIRLDETVTRANLAVLVKSLDELNGRRARLVAERDGSDLVVFPAELLEREAEDADAANVLVGERRLFAARRTARAGQKAQLRERSAQLAQEIEGLEAQRRSMVAQIAQIAEELTGVEQLYKLNLVTIARVAALRRESARLEGERGVIVASTAQAKGRIAEIELQIIQLDQDLLTQVLQEIREIEGKLGELVERKVAAEDQLQRIDIRSPQDGIVHQLSVHTIGGVIAAGETVMYVVPRADVLTVEVHVTPQDIDQLVLGQKAVVRLSAFSQRSTPELFGDLTHVSADLTRDQQSGVSYYVARVRLPVGELERLRGLKLVPGMPAEVHIQTGARTALSYLVKPLADQIARAFKED